MRCASIVALGVSVVVFAAIRLPIVQSAALVLLLAVTGGQAKAQFRDVVVFGDASLRARSRRPTISSGSRTAAGQWCPMGSSALAKQIENGMPADVFIPADLDSMAYVAERKLIKPDTREKFLGNKLVLIARADSNVSLTIGPNFPLVQALGDGRLAMAELASVAAGKYGKAALEKFDVWASVASKVTSTPDARAALLLVARGEATLGIVCQTDAAADKTVKIVATFPEASHPPIIYPIAILANSTNGVAPIYVQYLLSPKAEPFFEKHGFVVY